MFASCWGGAWRGVRAPYLYHCNLREKPGRNADDRKQMGVEACAMWTVGRLALQHALRSTSGTCHPTDFFEWAKSIMTHGETVSDPLPLPLAPQFGGPLFACAPAKCACRFGLPDKYRWLPSNQRR
jgi:hypothetical protein